MNDSNFESLGLSETILKALSGEGYERPTPIQAACIPSLLAGRDLLGCAQTGTGKTAAFALPIIQLLAASGHRPQPKCVRALVVAPTRELAAQIDASFAAYGRGSRLTQACVFGGVGKAPQEKALARGVDVLVATPGRLLDLHGERKLSLAGVEIVVLDEADRMLDMGFIRDVRKIVALLPKERQTLLFSATMPPSIAALAAGILKDPLRVDISPATPTVELIEQSVAYVDKNDKRAFLTSFIQGGGVGRAIVFTRTKHGADRLVKSLEKSGIAAAAIHANKSQNNRTRTLDGFRAGTLRILVATDLAARGIDVDDITHVFNYELPNEPETYVHRIGRTARAGASGVALALVDAEEKGLLRDIEKLIGRKVPLAAGPAIDEAYKAAAADRALGPKILGTEEHREPRGPRGRPARDDRGGEPRGRQPGGRDSGPRGGGSRFAGGKPSPSQDDARAAGPRRPSPAKQAPSRSAPSRATASRAAPYNAGRQAPDQDRARSTRAAIAEATGARLSFSGRGRAEPRGAFRDRKSS